jgi:fatty-acyl-CoA synthase
MAINELHTSTTYARMLIKALARFPDRVALVQDDTLVTYRQLAASISQMMQVFTKLGLRPGDGIAQLARNSICAATVQLASYVMGLRYTPLHPLGSQEDHAHILSDSEAVAFAFDPNDFLQHAKDIV